MSDIRTTKDIDVGEYWTVRTARDGDRYEAVVIEYVENRGGAWQTKQTDDGPRVTEETLYAALGSAIDAFCETAEKRLRHERRDADEPYLDEDTFL